jgi:putative transposase
VVQRGNNREACFIEPENYQFYLVLWEELSRRYGLKAHAYCLMTNHVHVLVTPENGTAVSNTMKGVGSRYALVELWHQCLGRLELAHAAPGISAP